MLTVVGIPLARDELLEVAQPGLGIQLGGSAVGGAEHADHVAQLVQGGDAQLADRARRLPGIGSGPAICSVPACTAIRLT